jgi:hypothetical protein
MQMSATYRANMRELLKLLNDLNPSELSTLDDGELARLEALCQKWTTLSERERGRRTTLPQSDGKLC